MFTVVTYYHNYYNYFVCVLYFTVSTLSFCSASYSIPHTLFCSSFTSHTPYSISHTPYSISHTPYSISHTPYSNSPILSSQHEGIEVTLTQSPMPKSDVKDLQFGKEFSDHMLLANWTKPKGWDVPKIVPYGDLSLSPALSALHYSTEVCIHMCIMIAH